MMVNIFYVYKYCFSRQQHTHQTYSNQNNSTEHMELTSAQITQ